LKEMVVLPLLYPEVFERFGTEPPRGVLFTGPPGTGKTLTARALANSLSIGGGGNGNGSGNVNVNGQQPVKVSFFMRKGADCLSKWVGEGERQLRLLFEQAKRYQPSIIFFDEIDGLAPVRSVKQDQIHASIVSTLLALMDGLDSRGQVVVIGATNRPDAIDPALRRPGRFDRELLFSLPDSTARREILNIHTKTWNPPLSHDIKRTIVERTDGYCGADMKALCSEAALISLRRAYPTIYESTERLDVNTATLKLSWGDFEAALGKIVPASRRSITSIGRPLDASYKLLLNTSLINVLKTIQSKFYPADKAIARFMKEMMGNGNNSSDDSNISRSSGSCGSSSSMLIESESKLNNEAVNNDNDNDNDMKYEKLADADDEIWVAIMAEAGMEISASTTDASDNSNESVSTVVASSRTTTYKPRLLIHGPSGAGQTEVARAAMQALGNYPCYTLEIGALLSDPAASSPEQALLLTVKEALRIAPSCIFLPNILSWWGAASPSLRIALISALQTMPPDAPLFWLTTLEYDNNGLMKEDVTYSNADDYDAQTESELMDIKYVLATLSGFEFNTNDTNINFKTNNLFTWWKQLCSSSSSSSSSSSASTTISSVLELKPQVKMNVKNIFNHILQIY
jgi:ATPase family AAA domain-containing protein 2